jgi:hypothetical protein
VSRGHSAFPRRRRARAGAGQLGASVFIVVLVLAMLTAIGVFAARSSRLSTTASGHARQMTQTHYLTEYGMKLSLAAVASAPDAYVHHMRTKPDTTCFAMAGAQGASCLKLHAPNLQAQLFPGSNGALVEPPAPPVAGSLGPANLEPSFSIEITSYTGGVPAPGFDLSPDGTSKFNFAMITMTGVSQVRPSGALSWTSSESARAFLIVGPL